MLNLISGSNVGGIRDFGIGHEIGCWNIDRVRSNLQLCKKIPGIRQKLGCRIIPGVRVGGSVGRDSGLGGMGMDGMGWLGWDGRAGLGWTGRDEESWGWKGRRAGRDGRAGEGLFLGGVLALAWGGGVGHRGRSWRF